VRKILTITLLTFLFISSIGISAFAQGDMITRQEKLVGSTSDFLVGFHTGFFDCNQRYFYPLNLGVMGQYNYIPNAMKMWYFGAEIGAFYAQNGLDGNNREMGLLATHISIFPGLKFNFRGRKYDNEGDFRQGAFASSLKIALGPTVGIPLKTYGTGPYYHPENAHAGFGFTAMALYQVTQRFSLFVSSTYIAADMDGFGFDPETGAMIGGNEYNASWWYKVGFAYNVLGQ
jgi:hypothetical protein